MFHLTTTSYIILKSSQPIFRKPPFSAFIPQRSPPSAECLTPNVDTFKINQIDVASTEPLTQDNNRHAYLSKGIGASEFKDVLF